MRTLLAAALRALLALAAMVAVLAFLERGMGRSADADIGGPAIAMAAIWLPLLVWGWYDAAHRPRAEAVRLWLIAGVVFAVAMLISGSARHGFDPWSLVVVPMVAAMEMLPALVGVAIGAARRQAHRGPVARG